MRQMQDKLNLPVLGIVDYNAHGLGILLTYKLGSVRLGLESFRYGKATIRITFEIVIHTLFSNGCKVARIAGQVVGDVGSSREIFSRVDTSRLRENRFVIGESCN